MPHLFDSLKIRSVTFPNRIAVSPMCEYSCENGMGERLAPSASWQPGCGRSGTCLHRGNGGGGAGAD